MFSTTDLIRPLAERGIELSSSQVYRLVVDRPERLSLKILMALLDILDCQMEELIEPVAASVRPRQQKAVGGDAGVEEAPEWAGSARSEPASPVSDGDDGGVDPAIAGPIGLIVSLIAAIEPGLRVEQIREAVIGVAGGRAKSRQLAAALRARPAVLLDGLSPAPAPSWTCSSLCAGPERSRSPGRVARMWQGAADVSAARPGLVLRGLRTAARAVLRLWQRAACGDSGPFRPAAMRAMPGWRQP